MLPRRGIQLRPRSYQRSHLATQLGCKISSDDIVQVDENKQTSISGIYAAGDSSSPYSQIGVAVTSGTIAAVSINRTLTEENLG